MNKLLTASALALMIASPAFAQDQDPTGVVTDENLDRENAEDLLDEGEMDDDFRYFRASDGRRFRLPRTFFGDMMAEDVDPDGAVTDENLDRMNTGG